ncbi:protein SRC2-like [Spinacia oleracea]|uniref:Protein SRC2-like n=1 Tax=Spinacia oleracea TaxID=3562 RepID=A0A9R0ID80_SPIOL|nr:protein SRC2-like [Spinacia oleracea]
MEHRPIEVKLLCAKDLKDVNVFSKMDVYIIGSVSGDPRSIQRTTVDKDGGTNPKWNHEMNFTFDESAARMNRLGLVFQIMSHRTLGDKEIGRVYVPLKELLDNFGVGDGSSGEVINHEKDVVYQVQTLNGKFKGKLEFSFKFGEKFSLSVERKLEDPVIAYPAVSPNPGVGSSIVSGFGSPPPSEPKSKYKPSVYPDPNIGGATPFSHGALQPGYPPQGYGHGYGYGCGYGYQPHYVPQPFPNPHISYGYGFPGGYGYAGQSPTRYTQQQVQQKPKKSKFGLGAATGIGAGLLGGLLVGEMVEDDAESYDDDTFDY